MHAVSKISILHTVVHVTECLCEVQGYLRRRNWAGLGGASQDNLKGIRRKLFLLVKFFCKRPVIVSFLDAVNTCQLVVNFKL